MSSKLAPAQATKNGRASQPSSTTKLGRASSTGPTKLKRLEVGRPSPNTDLANKRKVLPKIKSNVEKFNGMLSGSLSDLLPKSPSEVRIFLSSTFSDYRSERNWLIRDAFKELQAYCADQDLDFRVVDMRWGVTDDATNEHITEKLCQSEIATCKRVSLGPNFVCMLGNRYGYQPLPYAFIAKEFDILYKEAKEVVEHPEAEILHKWYSKDDNNIPPVYCIKPIHDNIANFGNHAEGMEAARLQATVEWGEQLLVIHAVLRAAASSLCAKNVITAARKHDFFKSVTEVEVTDGILEAYNPNDHALCYLRHLDGLDESRLSEQNALRNIDGLKLDGQLVLNKDVVKYQNTLKEGRVPTHLQTQNIRRYDIPWEEGGIDPQKHITHKQYLAKFCRDFVVDVRTLIERALDQKDNRIPTSEYYTEPDEAIHHAHFCVSKCALFRGQEKPLSKIREYLKAPKNRKPLVVYAESGIGKTSILAMAMKLVPEWLGVDAVRVIRFLGTSPHSGTLYDMLFSVMGQLADYFHQILEPVSYNSIKKLVEGFPRFLRNISRKSKSPIVIFLDSIDQLSPQDQAFLMKWLPIELPSMVNIVISMLPNYENILENTRKVINDEKCFVEVQPLPMETGRDIIDSYLKSKGRKVNPEQQKLLTDCLKNEPSPLFLKLFLDKALSWRSNTPTDTIRLESSVREAINHLFEDLEIKFGRTLVQRALGYITVGMDGLSELEIEDVLSCDDTVLNEVYVYHDPPVEGTIRVPPLLWSRIRIHINEYLTERTSYGKTTLFWYHRQFIEVASDRYAQNNDAKILHRRLAELYLAEKEVKKDVTLSKRKNLTIHKADRQVTPQPMSSRNKRMLQCLPYHLRKAQNVAYAKQVALCNLRFLMTRMESFGMEQVIKDFTETVQMSSNEHDQEIEFLVNALKAAKSSVKVPSQLPLQLLARLRHDRTAMPHIAHLLDKARDYLENSSQPQILPLYPCLVSTSDVVWSGKKAKLESFSSDITKFVIKQANEPKEQSNVNTEMLVLDGISQKVVLQKDVHPDRSDIACITGDGKKFISIHRLETVPEKNGKKAKSSAPQHRAGDIVLDVIDYNALRDGKEVTPKLQSLSELKIKDLETFGVSRDGLQVALVYNKSIVSIYDAKTGSIVRTETEYTDALEDVSKITWFGKNFCLIFSGDKSDGPGVLILSTDLKRKPQHIQLPGMIRMESLLWLSDTNELISSCVKDNVENVIIIGLKSGKIQGQLDLPEGKVALNIPLMESKRNILITTDNRLFMVSNGSMESLRELIITGKSGTVKDIVCGCADGSSVLFADKAGTLHAYQITEDVLSSIGHVHVSDPPLTSMYFNEDEETLLCVGESEIKLWNWQLLKQKLVTSSSRSPSKTAQRGSSLGSYGSASRIVGSGKDRLFTVSPSAGVIAWDIDTQEKLNAFGKGVDPKTTMLVAGGSVLLILDKKAKKLFAWATDSGAEVEELKYLHSCGSILAVTASPDADEVYIISERERQRWTTTVDMRTKKITQTFPGPSQELVDTSNIELAISGNKKYLFVIVPAKPMQLEILLKSEKKNNLTASAGKFLFYAIDLQKKSGQLITCNRQLTTVPCLGESWLGHKDSTLIIGRSRVTLIWDVDTGTNDQRLIKGTKIGQFYRPEWIEDYPTEHMKRCYGQMSTMVMSANGEVMATGSEDGFAMIYNAEKGGRLGAGPKRKQPHHQGHVTNIALSPDGRWAATYATDRMLKFWCLPEKEITSIKLPVTIKEMTFTADGLTLAVLGINGVGVSSVLMFRTVGQLSAIL